MRSPLNAVSIDPLLTHPPHCWWAPLDLGVYFEALPVRVKGGQWVEQADSLLQDGPGQGGGLAGGAGKHPRRLSPPQ